MRGILAKALGAMRHPARPLGFALMRRTKFNYAKEVGTGIDASVVMAPVQWIQRALPEARLRVMRKTGDTTKEVEGHDLVARVSKPNPFYGDAALWSATAFSYLTDGNAYWFKVRSRAGKIAELWYVPHWLLKPVSPRDGSAFLSHYEYMPGGQHRPMIIDPDDVVHFRHGVDPRDPRLGLSPLRGVLREIFTDLEASNFVASLLRNKAVPGIVISPDGSVSVAPDDVEATKKWFQDTFAGDNAGNALVMGAATKIQEFGFNPQQLDLSAARDVAEERVCASLGIPAAVVGFGAGLQTAKVGATMGEMRTLAWTNGVIPLLRSLADELQRSLSEMLGPNETVEHDTSEVGALAEQRLARAQTWDTAVRGGWAMVAEGREGIGLDVDDSHRIYLRPFSAVEVPAGAPPRIPESAAIDMRGLIGKSGRKQTRREPSDAQRGYVHAIDAMQQPLGDAFERRLVPVFAALGQAAAEAARPLLEEADLTVRAGRGEHKSPEDEILAGRILEQLELPLHRTTFQRGYEAHYLQVAKEVAKAGEMIGLATNLPDPVARAVVAAGGRRAGLVDLSAQSRAALFNALAEGRAAGEGVEQLAARIRDQVAAGPWTSAETRARTIARTETKYAQNVSTIARAGHEGVDRFLVFDGRLGPGRSAPDHIACTGGVLTADQAAVAAQAARPNCTISFTPLFEDAEPAIPAGCWLDALF